MISPVYSLVSWVLMKVGKVRRKKEGTHKNLKKCSASKRMTGLFHKRYLNSFLILNNFKN